MGAVGKPLIAQQSSQPAQLTTIDVKDPGGQILSYRYQSTATDVRLQGTSRAPKARIKLKIGSRPGFVELDINRGVISGLEPAHTFGKDFLTYVLWAVSVDGRASNLGEITFSGQSPVSINVTTPYQTFWLMVTAEPDYAVADPSSMIVLYSVDQNGGDALPEKRAQKIDGKLFYYTHYNSYNVSKGTPDPAPNELLQARKALELASKAVAASIDHHGQKVLDAESRVNAALTLARDFHEKAEAAYKKDPKGSDVVQFSRTAAQIAENARALSLGAVGDVAVRRLENELHGLQSELKALKDEKLKSSASDADAAARASGTALDQASSGAEAKSLAGRLTGTVKSLAKQPITWFGVIGWSVVILLLFRRPSV